MHNRIGPFAAQEAKQQVVVPGDVEAAEPDLPAADLAPGLQSLLDGRDRGQGLDAQINVDLAPAQVVNDQYVMTGFRQVHRARPPTEAVAAENENLHP